ncbi:MAG: metallophosphoesterase [Verrucomicrobiales bacterium]|nr:metallophosphoesterase [Verrucomicrobiales bacterium]
MNPAPSCALRPARSLGSLLLLALAVAAGIPVSAWSVYNDSSVTVRARVLDGDWDVQIPPGQNASCHWSDTDCNPLGLQSNPVTLQVETLDGDTRDFNGVVSMQAGGHAVVAETARPILWLAPGNLYVESFTVEGVLQQRVPYGVDAALRRVRFLVSADCQYCAPGDCGETDAPDKIVVANAVQARMIQQLRDDPSIRGVCYAGDLTQFASGTELDMYRDSISGFSRFFFDGLGNHDFERGRERVREYVTERKRSTVKTQKGDPHYSWDWHDVHFVQLNLMPADQATPDVPGVQDFSKLDPMAALTFLNLDLAIHVGRTGRPVVLMHHYGFDSFSTGNGWWTPAQRLAYWNVIASYNVVAIFTGHQHLYPSHQGSGSTSSLVGNPRFIRWERPVGAVGGPAGIPTYVAGAALYGAYLDVEINAGNQIRVTLRDQTGATQRVKDSTHNTPLWMNANNGQSGLGAFGAGLRRLQDLESALADRIAGVPQPTLNVLFEPGHHPGTARFASPARLSMNAAGTVRLGP